MDVYLELVRLLLLAVAVVGVVMVWMEKGTGVLIKVLITVLIVILSLVGWAWMSGSSDWALRLFGL